MALYTRKHATPSSMIHVFKLHPEGLIYTIQDPRYLGNSLPANLHADHKIPFIMVRLSPTVQLP